MGAFGVVLAHPLGEVGYKSAQRQGRSVGAVQLAIGATRAIGVERQTAQELLGEGPVTPLDLPLQVRTVARKPPADAAYPGSRLVDRAGDELKPTVNLSRFPGQPESGRQGRPREVRDGTHLPSRVPP